MDNDLRKAKAILTASDCTCVLCKDRDVRESRLRGIRPLLEFLDSGTDFRGYCAADKVVGKATAFLYCLLGVKAVYAPVISKAALQVLEAHGIEAVFALCADAILNHRRDGFCPMETATKNTDDPQKVLHAIRQTLENLH